MMGAVGYDPVNLEADIITVSHNHADHNNIKDFKNTLVVKEEGKTLIKDLEIEGILSYHDNDKGKLRGENIIFTI
ncbi:MAG: MBL fold metallo-hydrolase [Candidatus Omnitrophica bacterium]|nr:MBL fold metallo-hydrolase [Candidatus Omnitrophota bacterium]